MAISLTTDEVSYLKELVAAGVRGRTISAPTPRHGLERLVQNGYVVDRAISMDTVHYLITDLGRRALEHSRSEH